MRYIKCNALQSVENRIGMMNNVTYFRVNQPSLVLVKMRISTSTGEESMGQRSTRAIEGFVKLAGFPVLLGMVASSKNDVNIRTTRGVDCREIERSYFSPGLKQNKQCMFLITIPKY